MQYTVIPDSKKFSQIIIPNEKKIYVRKIPMKVICLDLKLVICLKISKYGVFYSAFWDVFER